MTKTASILIDQTLFDRLEKLALQLRVNPQQAPELGPEGKLTTNALARELLERAVYDLEQRLQKRV